MRLVLVGQAEGRPVRLDLAEGTNRVDRACLRAAGLTAVSVSRSHAEIECRAGRAVLRDLGSSNGTWADGELVTAERPIEPGTRLRFGEIELVLADADDDPPPSPHPAAPSLAPAGSVFATASLGWDEIRTTAPRPDTPDSALVRVLAAAGETLVVSRPLDETLARLLDLTARIVTARRTLILLCEDGDPAPRIRAARPAIAAGEALALSHTLVQTVLDESRALLVTDVQDDERFREQESIVQLRLRSAMVAPLFDNTRVIGLLYADSDDPRAAYNLEHLRVFSFLANLAAIKITNTRLEEVERERERLRQELGVAALIQRRLLPADLPAVAGYEFHALQVPCHEVGGDLYEAAALPDGRIVLAVGDVSGKGIGAALLMANVMASLRILYQEPPDVQRWIDRIHRQLLLSSDATHFATLFLALVDPAAHRLVYASAGHDPALVAAPGRAVRELGATGLPAGMLAGAAYEAGAVDLAPGELVAIYTDGLREAARAEVPAAPRESAPAGARGRGSGEEEIFGAERIADALSRREGRSLAEIATGIFTDVTEFTGAVGYEDDATLLLVRRT